VKKAVVILVVAIGAALAGASVVEASTPKPSGYCSKKELGKVVTYTTPSKSSTYKIKCVPYTAYHWKKA
jgi:hypothetical protein